MLTKCACQHCGKQIEFEAEHFQSGSTAECPHCHQTAQLRLNRWSTWSPARNIGGSAAVSDSMIAVSYLGALLLPIIGFFCGVYLMAKKEHGHGAACMAVSILTTVLGVMLLSQL